MRTSAVSRVSESTSAERNEAGWNGLPTLTLKYSSARAVMSSAFSWNPYGVSSRTAGTGRSPSLSSTARWTRAIVGVVSPEPMIVRMRGSSLIGPAPLPGWERRRSNPRLSASRIAAASSAGRWAWMS